MSSPPPVHSCVFLRRSGAVRVPHAQKQALLSHWVFSPAARQRGLLYKLLGWKIPSPRFSHEAGRRPAGTLINLLSPGEKQASFIASPTQPMSAQYFSHSSGLLSIYLCILSLLLCTFCTPWPCRGGLYSYKHKEFVRPVSPSLFQVWVFTNW